MARIIKKISLFLICCLFPALIRAQTFDDFKNQINDKYSAFEEDTRKAFSDYVEKVDKEFEDYLLKNFGEYKAEAGNNRNSNPKPKQIPKANEEKGALTTEPLNIRKTESGREDAEGPVLPAIRKNEETNFAKDRATFQFLGGPLFLDYDKKIKAESRKTNSPEAISAYWAELSNTNYNHLLFQLAELKSSMNLNDWAYYLLLKEFSKALYPADPDMQSSLIWFLMSRSEYNVRIAYNANGTYFLMPSVYPLYETDFLRIGNRQFYLVDRTAEQLFSFEKDFPEADLIPDLSIRRPLNIPEKAAHKKFSFNFDEKPYEVDLAYNLNLTGFYSSFPPASADLYFNSIPSGLTRNSVNAAFGPLLKGKTKEESAAFLLAFVQQAFEYKTDEESWGRERYFFPEEILEYPYADCEDRSVFYSWLVTDLLDMDVVGLSFPGHMATGINLDPRPEGEYFAYEGKDYLIADPTYTGAPPGLLMPLVKGQPAEIIPVINKSGLASMKDRLWDIVRSGGGYRSDLMEDVVIAPSGNAYICGYFMKDAAFGDLKLHSDFEGRDMFIAKFDPGLRLVWVKSATGPGNDMAYSLALGPQGVLYVYGSLENDLNFGDQTLSAQNAPDVFVARYNPDGQVLWASKAGIDKLDHSLDFLFAASFNPLGEKIMAKLYNHSENFDNYGLGLDEDGNAIITGSFFATTGLSSNSFVNYEAGADFDAGENLKSENDALIGKQYEKTIAGLFAALYLLNVNSLEIKGETVQKVVEEHSDNFKELFDESYKNFGRMNFLKNASGIIRIKTNDGKPALFGNIQVADEARIKIVKYESGNLKVEILSGIYAGRGQNRIPMNSVKLYKENGDLLLDFDEDHSQKKLNLRTEILKMK